VRPEHAGRLTPAMAVEELEKAPDLRPLYGRALLSALPGGGGDELPERELSLREVAIERGHLAAYNRVCGFRLGDELPPTYPHVFAFPLAMKLMTDRAFPLPVLGLVHVENRIEQQRPLRASETLSFLVRAENLRGHAKGTQFDLVAEASVDGETIWRSTSGYLRRGAGSGSSSEAPEAAPEWAEAALDQDRPSAVWNVAGDTGRRYASVSGDVNPIHLRRLTARLFGFPRPIAHGMWTKARCLAAFEGRFPASYAAEVHFKKPVLLPARVALSSALADAGWALDLRDRRTGAPHLIGTIRAA
jgi:acyl dehydratase